MSGAPTRKFGDRFNGFSEEDVWHEMRVLGCDEAQAVRSLTEAHERLDD